MKIVIKPSQLALFCGFLALSAGCSSSSSPNSDAAAVSNAGSAGATLTEPTGTADCTSEPGIDSYMPGLSKLGASGLYGFEIVSTTPSPPALNDNTFVMRITDANGAALAGELSAALDMPEHGHSSPKTPVITFDASSGDFTLDPMDLFMVGLWRFTFTFAPSADAATGAAGASDGASATDTAVFELCLD
ncbi:MAG TPA: hypothetical protein VHV51_10340 [Polyangiaceae bacterium]|jgi:hypothetical protein|nr:hypothetical protein [Polyangiaceae bacterium]